MGLNGSLSAHRVHIAFFGMRNAGKSSLVNAITNQPMSVVSDVEGTTTDPVRKAMEILPLGPVEIIDTPGFDDVGSLGEKRKARTKDILKEADVAVLVVDGQKGLQALDAELIDIFKSMAIPYLVVYNKSDVDTYPVDGIWVSAKEKDGIEQLKETIGHLAKDVESHKAIIGDLIDPGDSVILVIPIDSSAPKGRLILPQQLVIRDILDHHGLAYVCQDDELEIALTHLHPKMVVTDSQRFGRVSKVVPESIPLTSFSILMARYKGILKQVVEGAQHIKNLTDTSKILISEGCTHHRQCGDIGNVKLPNWIHEYTGYMVPYDLSSGKDFPEDVSDYDLIIHCGGCMLNEKTMQNRLKQAKAQHTYMTNYGTAIAQMHGILDRSIALFDI